MLTNRTTQKLWSVLTAAMLVSLFAGPASASDWREDWSTFAAKTGEPGAKAWVQMISTPEAKALDKAWRDFRGYDATSLIASAKNIPAELKPGLVITKENIGSMPLVAKFLPQFWRDRLGDPWLGLKQIRIVPTSHYYMSAEVLAATKKIASGSLKINAEGELYDANGNLFMSNDPGIPFTKPTTGLELNYLQVAEGVGTDDMHFDPLTMTACGENNQVDRSYTTELWWRKMAGRTEMAPLGNINTFGDAQEAGAIVFKSPQDIRGLAGVRIRYPEVAKDDNFKVYIPTLRRTRTLTGTNGQDPLAAGLELSWDDWRGYWIKTDATKFDFKLVGETFILAEPNTGHAYNPLKMSADGCTANSVDLELRPVWILDVIDKTGGYQYSKERLYIDKELYDVKYKEMFDREGKIQRIWDQARDFVPSTGQAQWKNVLVANINAKRITYLEMKSDWENRKSMNQSLFNIDQLRNR